MHRRTLLGTASGVVAAAWANAIVPAGEVEPAADLPPLEDLRWRVDSDGFHDRLLGDSPEMKEIMKEALAGMKEVLAGKRPLQLLPARVDGRDRLPPRLIFRQYHNSEVFTSSPTYLDFDSFRIETRGSELAVLPLGEGRGLIGKLDRSRLKEVLFRFPHTTSCSRSGSTLWLSAWTDPPTE